MTNCRKGGQFYTPRSVVQLLVEMLEPYNGRVFDPCCGSGGMFVQSDKFVIEHQGKVNDISIYGQESNQTTWRLCKMNLAIRGGDIRKELVEARLVDCIVNLPAKLFLNTQIPACLWFLSRNKANGKYRNRTDEILFIDARNMGHLINRRTREFSKEDIQRIAQTYRSWRNPDGDYEDVKGFCNSASIERVRELDYVLTPGRYVGLPDEEDDFDYNERFASLKAEFEAQLEEEEKLNMQILENLKKVKHEPENMYYECEFQISDKEDRNTFKVVVLQRAVRDD
jgi:type I restriction-modification system DNA methylase subunit